MTVKSLEDLMKLIRKIEFNKTEPELLVDLVHKAIKAGEGERERLREINRRSHNLFKLLKEKGLFCTIKGDKEEINGLKKTPIGAVDGSFQVVGGRGGRWYVVLGIAQIIAKNGFTLQPIIRVDGGIESLEGIDEGDVYRRAEVMMMLGEIKALRGIAEILSETNESESYVLIDGPIIDPPSYNEEEYIDYRVDALRYCYNRGVNVIGFVKRVMGRNYIDYLKKEVGEEIDDFTNDLDLLSTIMFNSIRIEGTPIYTFPINYEEGLEESNVLPYSIYAEKGLKIFYSYYKPLLRGRIFRVEFASFEMLNEQKLFEKFRQIMTIINQIWTPPGMDEPLLITLAHNKCNVRRGAAETIYYEIIARALSEGNIHLWLESLS